MSDSRGESESPAVADIMGRRTDGVTRRRWRFSTRELLIAIFVLIVSGRFCFGGAGDLGEVDESFESGVLSSLGLFCGDDFFLCFCDWEFAGSCLDRASGQWRSALCGGFGLSAYGVSLGIYVWSGGPGDAGSIWQLFGE